MLRLLALALAVAAVDAQGKCVFTPGGKTCTCAGVDMSALMGKVYQAPTDAEGYAYSIAMCSEIPKASLPSGCQQYAEHPSVVKVCLRPPPGSPRCLPLRLLSPKLRHFFASRQRGGQ